PQGRLVRARSWLGALARRKAWVEIHRFVFLGRHGSIRCLQWVLAPCAVSALVTSRNAHQMSHGSTGSTTQRDGHEPHLRSRVPQVTCTASTQSPRTTRLRVKSEILFLSGGELARVRGAEPNCPGRPPSESCASSLHLRL